MDDLSALLIFGIAAILVSIAILALSRIEPKYSNLNEEGRAEAEKRMASRKGTANETWVLCTVLFVAGVASIIFNYV